MKAFVTDDETMPDQTLQLTVELETNVQRGAAVTIEYKTAHAVLLPSSILPGFAQAATASRDAAIVSYYLARRAVQ